MIIHHSENFSKYLISLCNPLKYSESFTFIPLKVTHNGDHKCIFQTPLLFTPYGIQRLKNNKKIIDITFQNKNNDNSQNKFLKDLYRIYKIIKHKYKNSYIVNSFIKNTEFNECIRLKINENTILFDEDQNIINTIEKYTYGSFIFQIEGLWINNKDIWFQCNLLQAKIIIPTHLKEYSFIDEITEIKENNDKYDKMIKMGVPKEAVERQKLLDGKIPPPPPLPGKLNDKRSMTIPKINANDLKSVILKKGKPITKKKIKKDSNHFEPPTLEELQTTLSRLKKIK
tara:strand:+ start:241 stop:1095 length:855 start_codon:yes stop_codon:yes gene_type:complete